jgi:AcrR family transcriptional regulator
MIELIAEQGYERTTAVEISLRAGYSRAMAHDRYGSKEALLDEIMRNDYEQWIGDETIAEASGIEQVLGRIDNVASLAASNPKFTRAMFILQFEALGTAAVFRERITDWIHRLGDAVESAVRLGQQDGSVRLDVDPVSVAEDLKSVVIGIAYLWALEPESVDLAGRLSHIRSQTRDQLEP